MLEEDKSTLHRNRAMPLCLLQNLMNDQIECRLSEEKTSSPNILENLTLPFIGGAKGMQTPGMAGSRLLMHLPRIGRNDPLLHVENVAP